ncbi:MAG: 4Fe-4S binding protein [Euryarchaeota archaeon]|nr:4Fe-4S binding protein [Euryarchaeota archaeon]
MIKRMIVKIDEEKCTGCGKCISPIAEGAIRIIDGKTKVISEELCDGMGFCIGICPEGAISIEERQTVAFDAEKASNTLHKDVSIRCFKCGSGAEYRYLLPVRHKKESLWIRTQYLPSLIHGC